MTVGIIILCRYDSSRLPGKILREIRGKPILQYIYERVQKAVLPESIVVATSAEASDNPIVEYCKAQDIQVFRGSKNNVAQRFLDCSNTYGFDFCTRINGDNLFVDSDLLRKMLAIAEGSNYDFISNVRARTFPRGMSIEIVRRVFYEQAVKEFDKPEYFEHVTLFFYEHEHYGCQLHITNQDCSEAAGINLAIDTPDDLKKAESLISRMTSDHSNYQLKEIFELMRLES
jgi:spore coat polysaccharide biosynthesis protein SpsF